MAVGTGMGTENKGTDKEEGLSREQQEKGKETNGNCQQFSTFLSLCGSNPSCVCVLWRKNLDRCGMV